jgi:hypothetical protein
VAPALAIAHVAIIAGSDRRSARPQPSAIARGGGTRDHTDAGRRRFLRARSVSRELDGGLGGAATSAVVARPLVAPVRRDRSMIRKYARSDQRSNFSAPLRISSRDLAAIDVR